MESRLHIALKTERVAHNALLNHMSTCDACTVDEDGEPRPCPVRARLNRTVQMARDLAALEASGT